MVDLRRRLARSDDEGGGSLESQKGLHHPGILSGVSGVTVVIEDIGLFRLSVQGSHLGDPAPELFLSIEVIVPFPGLLVSPPFGRVTAVKAHVGKARCRPDQPRHEPRQSRFVDAAETEPLGLKEREGFLLDPLVVAELDHDRYPIQSLAEFLEVGQAPRPGRRLHGSFLCTL